MLAGCCSRTAVAPNRVTPGCTGSLKRPEFRFLVPVPARHLGLTPKRRSRIGTPAFQTSRVSPGPNHLETARYRNPRKPPHFLRERRQLLLPDCSGRSTLGPRAMRSSASEFGFRVPRGPVGVGRGHGRDITRVVSQHHRVITRQAGCFPIRQIAFFGPSSKLATSVPVGGPCCVAANPEGQS
jgi:hypothetical protein